MNLKNDKDKALMDCIVSFLYAKRYKYVSFDDLPQCDTRERMQISLIWLAENGYISAQYNDEIGETNGEVILAKITAKGVEFMLNDYSMPLVINVKMDEEQLASVLLKIVEQRCNAEKKSILSKFFKATGDAGINAIANEVVSAIFTALPVLSKKLFLGDD